METSSTKIIGETFQKVADIVTQTMGAKGRLAVVSQELDKPLLTDDGVTVARQALSLEGFERMPAISMIEAAANTEKEAYDGTTLTVLLVNEFYKAGQKLIKKGMHPQLAADAIEELGKTVHESLANQRIKLDTLRNKEEMVDALATITTKIPSIGTIVSKAYSLAGNEMNVVIEHDMKIKETTIEHTDGLVLNSGYMSDVMRNFCNENSKTVYENASLVLLSEDIFTQTQILNFFRSLPEDVPPLVFFVTPNFNPESLKLLLDALVPNQSKGLKFQFVFLNEEATDELYLDVAGYTNGQCQDAALGTSNYTYANCGTAKKIIVEREKTTIIADGDVSKRIASYEEQLKNHKFEYSINTEASIRRRLSNLKTGLIKIKLNCPTVTEYMTIKLKLDDAIGAVRKAGEQGILPGCGRALCNVSAEVDRIFKPALEAPLRVILTNAGYDKRSINNAVLHSYFEDYRNEVVNLRTGEQDDALSIGVVDGFASIDTAVKNAISIASSYIRAYILIAR